MMIVGLVLLSGTFGYYWITDGVYDLFICLYMIVVMVFIVGCGEVISVMMVVLKFFNMGFILLGGGVILYFFILVTVIVIEWCVLVLF